MVQNPPEHFPRLSPYLYYRDAGAAIDFLTSAFGFEERFVMRDPEGNVGHAEGVLEDAVVMLGTPGPDYRNPKQLGGVTQGLYVYVDDVDKHFEVAQAAGATIVSPPSDQFYGDRNYTAADPEGHHWFFGQHVRDVSEEELHEGAAAAATEMNS